MSDVYIHYGHTHFDENLFQPIKNRFNWIKPFGGLWASPINALYGWKDWTADNNFIECNIENSFKFELKSTTRLLQIYNLTDLNSLPFIDGDNIICKTLDFEKLLNQYDAMLVMISSDRRLYWELYGWDCDSLLVFNSDIIEEVI